MEAPGSGTTKPLSSVPLTEAVYNILFASGERLMSFANFLIAVSSFSGNDVSCDSNFLSLSFCHSFLIVGRLEAIFTKSLDVLSLAVSTRKLPVFVVSRI